MSKPGDRIIGENADWERIERAKLKFPPVFLTAEQRRCADSMVPSICERGGWRLHVCAALPDHVHTLLTTDANGKTVRRLLKRWLGQTLSQRWPLTDGACWWAEGGSVKWVWDERYFEHVYAYIDGQRAICG